MLNNIIRGEWEESVWYELCFDDGHNNGFGFPCDEQGNVPDGMNPAAKENHAWCLEHPERFVRFNKVVCYKRSFRNPDHGTCHCGATVYLQNQYMGACECERCGQWYNLSGQELLPPDQWESVDYDY